MKRITFTLILACAFFISACNVISPKPTPTPTTTNTPTPTATNTPTSTPTNTPTPTPDPLAECNGDDVLLTIREQVEHKNLSVHYYKFLNENKLIIWYVAPYIDPESTIEEIQINTNIALGDSIGLINYLTETDPCISHLFDKANLIVVDSEYNGWLSYDLELEIFPLKDPYSESAYKKYNEVMTVGYARSVPPIVKPEPPENSCTWNETREKISRHISSKRANVDYYFVIDENGVNLWVSWDHGEQEHNLVYILNIVQELDCIYPAPGNLFITTVDGMNELNYMALLPIGDNTTFDLEEIYIIYEK